jgi:hypothetical protein
MTNPQARPDSRSELQITLPEKNSGPPVDLSKRDEVRSAFPERNPMPQGDTSGGVLEVTPIGAVINRIAPRNFEPNSGPQYIFPREARPEFQKVPPGKNEGPALAGDANQQQTTDFVRDHAQAVDWQKMVGKDNRAVFVGERHVSLEDKQELIDHLGELKKLGITHVGLEMVDSKDQHILDDFMSGKVTRDDLHKLFESRWNWGPEVVDHYVNLVQSIKDNGLKPVALDIDYNFNSITQRNVHWASTIDAVLKKDPSNRMVIYNGSLHGGYRDGQSANEILQTRYGHKAAVVDFAETDKVQIAYSTADQVSLAAQTLGKDQNRFMIPLDRTQNRQADWIVHLPQREKLI